MIVLAYDNIHFGAVRRRLRSEAKVLFCKLYAIQRPPRELLWGGNIVIKKCFIDTSKSETCEDSGVVAGEGGTRLVLDRHCGTHNQHTNGQVQFLVLSAKNSPSCAQPVNDCLNRESVFIHDEMSSCGLQDIIRQFHCWYARYQDQRALGGSCDRRTISKEEIDTQLNEGGIELNPGPIPKGTPPKVKRTPRRAYRPRQVNHRPVNVSALAREAGYQPLIPKQLGFPQSYMAALRYIFPQQQLTGGGVLNNFRLTSNHFDVDSALGSTAMAYYQELAAVYFEGRTLEIDYDFTVINDEANLDCQLIHGFSTTLFSSTALGMNYGENSFLHSETSVSWKGMGVKLRVKGRITIEKLFGKKQALYDDLFVGSTTASTLSSSATGYIYIGTQSSGVPVTGCNVTGAVTLKVLFQKKRSLTARVSPPAPRPNSCKTALSNKRFDLKPDDDPWLEYVKKQNVVPLTIEERLARLESMVIKLQPPKVCEVPL